jgi:hypothetical protein
MSVRIRDDRLLKKGPIMRLPLAIAAAAFIAVFLASPPAIAQNGHANGHAAGHGQGGPHGGGKPAGNTPTSAASTPKGHANGNPHKAPATTAISSTSTTGAATTVVTATTPIAGHTPNPNLAARLLKLLPPGSTIPLASAGFKNWGQFVAAVHVSHNLGIPFAALKARMIGPNPLSLGQAIQALRPVPAPTTTGTTTSSATTTTTTTPTTTRVRREVERAESEAAEDLREAAEEAREAAAEAREEANERRR